MVSVPVWLLAAQWTLLVALTLLVIVVYRQLAYFLELTGGNAQREVGLPVGARAPDFTYTPLRSPGVVTHFATSARTNIVMFSDPFCSSCERAVAALAGVVQKADPSDLRALVVAAEEPDLLRAAGFYEAIGVDVGIIDAEVHHRFRAEQTPLFFVLDSEGFVRATASVDTESAIIGLIAQSRVARSVSAQSLTQLEMAATHTAEPTGGRWHERPVSSN